MVDISIGNSFAGRMHFPGTVLMVEGTFQKHPALSSGFNRGVGLNCVGVAPCKFSLQSSNRVFRFIT
jgi:hypothetical protein